MTLSVKILTFMASQSDKVVPKHHNSFTRRKIGMRKKFAGRGALEGPRGSTRAPKPAAKKNDDPGNGNVVTKYCFQKLRMSILFAKDDPGRNRTHNLQSWNLTHYQLCYRAYPSEIATRFSGE